jgi:peroxiredoxin Q/BCP
MLLKDGDPAPVFELPDENGNIRTLQEFKGKKVVLYFYPKDNSLVCTRQACNLRDDYQILQELGIVILGVSYDSPESHKNFIFKQQLPFSLLSDQNKEVAKAYGASSGLLGKFILNRYTYLIDEQGIIIKIFKKVDVSRQAEQIIDAFKNAEIQ